MPTNNPYPWVTPAVAMANGFGSGGGAPAPTPAATPVLQSPSAAAAGQAFGRVARRFRSGEVQGVNTALRLATAPARYVGGAADDFVRGMMGAPQRANAGQPFGAPQLSAPSATAPTTPATAAPVPAAPAVGGAPATAGNAPATKPILWNPSTTQMRAAGAIPDDPRGVPADQLPVAPIIRPAIETGVTLADGRKLPYGAMVNGVPTFSDGSGGGQGHVASIPRTMTDAEIKGMGDQLPTVPAGTAPAPFLQAPSAFNSPDSEANIEAIMRSKQAGRFGVTPQMNAQADLAAVTNQDARTTLGRAAMNAARRAGGASSVLQRKSALDDVAGLDSAARANLLATTQGQNALDTTNAQGTNALQNTNLSGQYGLAEADVRGRNALLNRPPQRFQSADGSLWTMSPDGKTAPVLGTDGTQLKGEMKRPDEMSEKDYMTGINKAMTDWMGKYNENQALLPANARQPLTDQMIADQRAQFAAGQGLQTATNPKTHERMVNIGGRWVAL